MRNVPINLPHSLIPSSRNRSQSSKNTSESNQKIFLNLKQSKDGFKEISSEITCVNLKTASFLYFPSFYSVLIHTIRALRNLNLK